MQKSKPTMQNVAATNNMRSMKNDQNPATAHHTITTARRPDNIRSSILVRGRSIRSMARSGCQPRRPCPERIHNFAILVGFFAVLSELHQSSEYYDYGKRRVYLLYSTPEAVWARCGCLMPCHVSCVCMSEST